MALFEHVTFDGLPEDQLAFLGHWSWVYAHNDIDATEEYWLDTFTYEDVEYTMAAPSDIDI